MYIRKIRVRNLKLLRDVEIDFVREGGSPRPFTMLVGENGLCKTTLLQAIALAASGADRANQLAEVASYKDLGGARRRRGRSPPEARGANVL
jgi:DNA repair exonuclease SbcCD ATPase subunit